MPVTDEVIIEICNNVKALCETVYDHLYSNTRINFETDKALSDIQYNMQCIVDDLNEEKEENKNE